MNPGDFLVGGTSQQKIYAATRVREEVRGKWTQRNRRGEEGETAVQK
jgi:hypothetical protein